jgi:uncharacterized protein involved in tolerance to divalent cations
MPHPEQRHGPNGGSIYRWRGEVNDRSEIRVVLHTRARLVLEIVERADAEHPYEIPCVVTLPVTAGNPACLDWIATESRAPISLIHMNPLTLYRNAFRSQI